MVHYAALRRSPIYFDLLLHSYGSRCVPHRAKVSVSFISSLLPLILNGDFGAIINTGYSRI